MFPLDTDTIFNQEG